MRLSIAFGALLWLVCSAQSYKVLVYCPRFSQSINNFIGNIADILVDAGHNVTTLIPIIAPHPRDGTLKSNKIYVQTAEEVTKIWASVSFDSTNIFPYEYFNIYHNYVVGTFGSRFLSAHCKGVLDEEGLMERLAAEQFDVMIVDLFEVCGAALSHVIKPKSLITASGSVPGWTNPEFGLEMALSYNPSMLVHNLNVHSVWSRLTNIYAEFVLNLSWRSSRTLIDDLFAQRFGDFPGVRVRKNELSTVHYIGGIGAKTPNKLDQELDHLLSLRDKTVLISFGSVFHSQKLPLKVKQAIVEVVSRLPEVTFLWKYEEPADDFAKSVLPSTPNLHLFKWMPQNDILADDRLAAFITHGGMASTQETALRGKPGLFIPFLGDQPRNAGMMEKSGVGKVFHKLDLFNAQKLYGALKDLLENESYRTNAQRISRMIQKKPFSARETLIKTVEFAAAFGPSPALRPQSFDMNWIEHSNADIIAVFTLVLFVPIVLVANCIRKLFATKVKRE